MELDYKKASKVVAADVPGCGGYIQTYIYMSVET